MSSNKAAKEELIKICGPKCFIEELEVRSREEVQTDFKKYTSKSARHRMDELTFHHIIERFKGGKAEFNNGALLRNINHIWFNRLSKDDQEVLNTLFKEYRDYKAGLYRISTFTFTPAKLKILDKVDVDLNISENSEVLTIPVYENTLEDIEKLIAKNPKLYEDYKDQRRASTYNKFNREKDDR